MLATIHLMIVIATGLIVLYSDEQATLWIFGKKRILDSGRITFLHRSVSTGLALLLLTGGLLFIRAVPAYLTDTTFIIKMIAVAALVINIYFIEKFSHVATSRTFASLSINQRLPLFISGGISLLGWATAIICGWLLS